MKKEMPEQYAQLVELRNKLEMHYGEVQDYEFTIEKGTLYCLQTRNGKMNAAAQVKTSVDMFREGLISRDRVPLRIGPEILEQLLHSTLDPEGSDEPIPCGLPASPGAASGKFPPKYNESGILQDNPFEVLYVQGAGQLINMAVYNGRQVCGDLRLGICGEHGGHTESIRFCHHVGLNYVSCSGLRVPVARLAAANARLREDEYVAFQR
jgi:phosphoenolpyruvate synthase/pyruvate phosphate dikinase